MTMKMLLAVLAAVAVPAAAIELSLEENKAQRGSIGYIDMQRLFKTFPETSRAKESFEELVRQAEEQLNLRKAEILRMRSELAQLKAEREFLSKTPIEVPKVAPTPKPAGPTAAEKAAAEKAAAEKAAAEKAAAAKAAKDKQDAELKRILEQRTPPPQVADVNARPSREQEEPPMPSTQGRRQQEPETDLTRPSIANLPGFGETGGAESSAADMTPEEQRALEARRAAREAEERAKAQAAQPAAPPQDENAQEAAQQSKNAAAAQKQDPLIINIPGVSTAPILVQPPAAPPLPAAAPEAPAAPVVTMSTAPAQNPALVELDAKIAVKTKELATKELEYKTEQASSEKNLLELESRRTEMLLGKIHRAVQEIARKEGVSVVVDKSSILFGHDAVDLTEKVMNHLKGT